VSGIATGNGIKGCRRAKVWKVERIYLMA